MGWRKTLSAIAVLGAVLGASIGCAAEPEDPPVFASDEEALAAAEAALNRYLDVGSRVYSREAELVELLGVVTSNRAEEERDDYEAFVANGWRAQGSQELTTIELGSWESVTDETASVSVFACIDISDFRIRDANGRDITPPDREEVFDTALTFTGSATDLRLARYEPAPEDVILCG